MLRPGFDVNLGGSAPDDHEAIALVLCLEVAHVLTQLLGQIALGFPLLHVRAVNTRDVLVVEHGGHRLDAAQKIGDGLDVTLVQHSRLPGSSERVVGNRIPCAEDEVVQLGERNEILDERSALFGSLAKTDGRHLRQRSYRLGSTAPNAFDSSHECCGDCTEARRQYAKAAGGRRYGLRGGTRGRSAQVLSPFVVIRIVPDASLMLPPSAEILDH